MILSTVTIVLIRISGLKYFVFRILCLPYPKSFKNGFMTQEEHDYIYEKGFFRVNIMRLACFSVSRVRG